MSGFVHLHCQRRFLFGSVMVVVRAPPELRATRPGSFRDLPPEWLSGERLTAKVEELDRWAQETVGEDIVRAINALALQRGAVTRVFVSSENRLRDKVLAAPWELLEHTPAALRNAELAVVRLLSADAREGEPESVRRLRLLVLYANPAEDIAEMDAHIQSLRNFVAENEEKLEARIVCFDSEQTVLAQSAGFDPQVVYFVGHGYQRGDDAVQLRIGVLGRPATIDLSKFRKLVQQIGSPRLVILNACESFAGSQLDPYLGAALRLAPEFDYLVAMQMKAPVLAATHFAATLLTRVGLGEGMAAAMSASRAMMAAHADPAFAVTPYIPVLIQRIRLDVPYVVDAGEQELARLQKLMGARIERIRRLPREAEPSISAVLTREESTQCVSLLTGPADCGKSTTVRGVIEKLLTIERIREGERYLYYSAKGLELVEERGSRSRQLLQAFARDCGSFTQGLTDRLGSEKTPGAELAVVAQWFSGRAAAGYHFGVVLDDLPADVASDLARRAAGLVTDGRLMLVATDHDVANDVPVAQVTLSVMSESEIASAIPGCDVARARQIREDTGGVPLFVAAAARGERGSAAESLAEALRPAGPEGLRCLELVALSQIPVPAEVITQLQLDASVVQRVTTPLLVSITSEGAFTMPEPVRRELQARLTPAEELALRNQVAPAYEEVAYGERTGGFRRPRVIRFYGEALRQRTRMLSLPAGSPPPAIILGAARDDIFDLDHQLLEEGDEPAAAKALWDMYLSAASSAGFGEERATDARYARCLQRLGVIDQADEILRRWTSAEVKSEDELQVRVLLLHADVLKDLGKRDARDERLGLLARAATITQAMRRAGTVEPWRLDEHEANIEWSIGNTLGYGERAEPETAIAHLARATELYERLRDQRAESVYAEKIEVARYNGLLSEAERAAAVDRIQRGIDDLLARPDRWEAIMRLYELGRLETDEARRAEWFRSAYERAGDGYAPLRWHAGIRWKRAEVEGRLVAFEAAAPTILEFCGELRVWQEGAWSRRVLRDALQFLAHHFETLGDQPLQRDCLLRCSRVAAAIARRGEGRRDREVRRAVEESLRSLDQGTERSSAEAGPARDETSEGGER